jgi:hypothetical protein
VAWKTFNHPNVLPLLGVTIGDSLYAITSEWIENGNINEFIKSNEDVDRFKLVRLRFCYDQRPVLMSCP